MPHLNVRDLSAAEIDRLRQVADASPDWTFGQQIHTLLDAYEEREETSDKLDDLKKQLGKLGEELTDSLDVPMYRGKPRPGAAKDRLSRLQGRIKMSARDLAALEAKL